MYDNLTTVESLKRWMKIPGTNDDAVLASMIQAASDLIGRYCERPNLGNVYTYSESYFRSSPFRLGAGASGFNIVLRHYPVTVLTSCTMNNTTIQTINNTQFQSGNSGYYLIEGEESRIVRFSGLGANYPITIAYSAGYLPNAVPFILQQACNQFAAEMFKMSNNIGVRSTVLAGETVSFDPGSNWAMSARVKAMVQPFRNMAPFTGMS